MHKHTNTKVRRVWRWWWGRETSHVLNDLENVRALLVAGRAKEPRVADAAALAIRVSAARALAAGLVTFAAHWVIFRRRLLDRAIRAAPARVALAAADLLGVPPVIVADTRVRVLREGVPDRMLRQTIGDLLERLARAVVRALVRARRATAALAPM